MFSLIAKLIKIDSIATAVIYSLNLIISLTYVCLIWRDGYFADKSMFLIVFYSFAYGVSIVIDIVLLRCLILMKNNFLCIPLILAFVAMQGLVILADIAHAFRCNYFWSTGYILLTFEAVMIVVYLHRYFVLREINAHLPEEMEESK